MIEKTLKTTQGKLNIKIPTHLNEVTLGQMMELQDKPDVNDLEAIGILSGVPVEQLNNVSSMADLQVFGDAVLSLSHQIKYLYNSDDIPEKATFFIGESPVTVNVSKNLSVEPAGAFMAARDIIADEINEHTRLFGKDDLNKHFNPSLKACCQVLSHYFYCRATGKPYHEYDAEEFCAEVKKLRVTEALPIAKHFFTCYPCLSKPRTGFFHCLQQHWKKRQEYNLSKNLNTSTP